MGNFFASNHNRKPVLPERVLPEHVLPELTGPYPSVIKTELVTEVNSDVTDEVKRLGDFVHLTSKAADVRNRYTPAKLSKHTSFIENNMQTLVGKVGEYDSMLSSKELLRRGSSYSGTKVMRPDEYDYMPILANFNTNTVEVEDVADTCYDWYRDKGYGYIKVKPGALSIRHNMKNTRYNRFKKYLCSVKLFSELRKLIIKSLQHMDTLTFIGVRDHENTNAQYKRGEISIHRGMHGTSFWLRVGGPLCTTDIDLCFSIEGNPTEQLGPCLMVNGETDKDKCECGYSYSQHWMKSVINPPVNTKYVLSESHMELFLTLKYITHLASEMSHETDPETLSSYTVKMVLLTHQQTCKAVNVGECFMDIVRRIRNDKDINNLHIYSPKYTHDVFFPERVLYLHKSHSRAAIAWFMFQVSHTEDDGWIHKLLRLTQEPHTPKWWDKQLSKNDRDSRQLRDLMKVIKTCDSWHYESSGYDQLRLEWYHRDGSVKASLTLEYK
ncbi:unnamed protein product [Owenia fusiformis]|uniref:Uncharacterized protein n=1 Tax=Owenia fusiformis TaxID=6347 RepID=A0A8J1UEV3_OWEFU|nr:unnamed protein product [Owenia fusiformis]